MKKNLNIKQKAASAAILGSALLLGSTFAFFTDRAQTTLTHQSGKVSTAITNDDTATKTILPGAAANVEYSVQDSSSTGGVGVDSRDTILVYATNAEGELVDLKGKVGVYSDTEEDELGNTVGETELTGKKTANKGVMYTLNKVKMDDGAKRTSNYKVVLATDADNSLASATYHVAVVTEAKQAGDEEYTDADMNATAVDGFSDKVQEIFSTEFKAVAAKK